VSETEGAVFRRRFVVSLGGPAGMTGALSGFVLTGVGDGLPSAFLGLLIGWLYGYAVLGLIRAFRVSPSFYWLVGILCGPVPFVFLAGGVAKEDRGGIVVLTAVFGLVVGLVEWGHRLRVQRDGAAGSES
jgi:hypothetical protein